MERRLLLFAEVFLSLWCLSLQQEQNMKLCRGDRYVLAQCRPGAIIRTPFPGQLPPGWGRTCQAGTTPCVRTNESTVGSTQHYDQYQCDSETWNLNYLCLPASQFVDMCQDVMQTRNGETSLVHSQLMASRGNNVTCTCVVTRTPGSSNYGIEIKLYTRDLAQAKAASCQGKLTLRDTLATGPTLCLLTTTPTGQNTTEGYAPYLNGTNSLTITYELNGGATSGQDQLLPFALRLSGSGSYDIECGRSDDDVTESTGSAAPTATSHTNPEFKSTSVDNPTISSSATDPGGREDPVAYTTAAFTAEAQPNGSRTGLTIGLALGLAVVVLVVLVIGVCCFLRRRRMTRHKPLQADEDRENSANLEMQIRNSVSESLGTDPDLGTPASTQRSIRSLAPEGAPPPGPLVIRDVRSRKAHKGPYAVVDIQSGVDVTSAIIKDGDVGELSQEADVGSPYELAKGTPPLSERKAHAVNNNYIAKDHLEDDHTKAKEQSLNADNVAEVGRPDGRDVTMDTSGLYDMVQDRDVHLDQGLGQEGDDDVDPYSVTLRRNRKDKPPPESDHESGRPREAEGRPHGDEGRDGSDTEAGSGGGEATGGDGVEVDPSDTYATVDRSRKDRDSADLIMQENTVYGSQSQPIEN